MEEKEFLDDGTTPNPKYKKPEDNAGGDKTTLTKEEHQKELDRVAAKTRQEEREKLQKEFDQKLEDAKTEERRLAKLSQDEQAKENLKKQSETLASQRKELDTRENTIIANEKLSELGVPKELSIFVVSDNKDDTVKAVENIAKVFNDAVAKAVADKVKGTTPTANNNAAGAGGNTSDKLITNL